MNNKSKRGEPWWLTGLLFVTAALATHEWGYAAVSAGFTLAAWHQWHRRWPYHARVKLRFHARQLARGRVPVGHWLRSEVMERDSRRCVHCGRGRRLEIDHVQPVSHGGRTVYWNLAVLCYWCNRVKSNYWPGHSYRPWPGYSNKRAARQILISEQVHLKRCREESIAA